MEEAGVSTVLELLAVLGRQVEQEVRLVVGVDEEVEKLTDNFRAIQCVLEDAERRQVKDKAVGHWLGKLNEVSCDMEDVLDEWNTAIQKRDIMEADENVSKLVRKVRSLITCFGFCSWQVVKRHDIAKKIKDLNVTLADIANQRNMLHLISSNTGTDEVEGQITSSFVDSIHGRDHVMRDIKNWLLSESSDVPDGPGSRPDGLAYFPIISIVGMGGIGKTALAGLVFNDDEVKGFFDKTIWVHVSQRLERIKIAKAILECFEPGHGVNAYETLLQKLKELITDKKFLLVLDDVWNGESNKWEQLGTSLKHGSRQSRILVTTRKENHANLMGSTRIIPLQELSHQGSWLLFSQVVFSGRIEEECQKFEDIGREIVKKFKGFPLAIKTLGNLLRFKKTIEGWQRVLNSEMWELEEVKTQIFPALLLSYFDLPFELKTCFLYCAIFPKDYIIKKEQLIMLWMSHAYLKPKQNEDMELVGEEYFEKLTMTSFFQYFERRDDESIISCKMHDMVHDLAQYLTKNECYSVERGEKGFVMRPQYKNTRHAMIVSKEEIPSSISLLKGEDPFPISVFEKNRLRSLLLDGVNCPLDEIFDNYASLRALALSDMLISDVPIGISKLIHLRYLDISRNGGMKEIPEAICELYNLQTLGISNCGNLNKLPEGIGQLINLRHLINRWSFTECEYMPAGIKRLTSLRTLGILVVSGDKTACKFEYLRNFNHLGGFLHIKCCGVNVGEINKAELNNKTKLYELVLELSSDVSNEKALEDFQPPPNLEELHLRGYSGHNCLSLDWLMMSLTKLKRLTFLSWFGSESFCLGKLPFLESLEISELNSLRRLGNEFLGRGSDNMTSSSSSSSVAIFPKLQSLFFWKMEEWEKWDGGSCGGGGENIKIMPSLCSLKIHICPRLETLPDYLLQLTTLEEFNIAGCPLLESRYRVENVGKLRIYQNSETSSPIHQLLSTQTTETATHHSRGKGIADAE